MYSIRALGHTCMMWVAYMFGAYANNMKYMCTSACCDMFDCGKLI